MLHLIGKTKEKIGKKNGREAMLKSKYQLMKLFIWAVIFCVCSLRVELMHVKSSKKYQLYLLLLMIKGVTQGRVFM